MLSTVRKAVAAFVVAFAGTFAVDTEVTDWKTLILRAVFSGVTAAAVYFVPNATESE